VHTPWSVGSVKTLPVEAVKTLPVEAVKTLPVEAESVEAGDSPVKDAVKRSQIVHCIP
jgi:hypothetical protein